jgi:hypothetical protein
MMTDFLTTAIEAQKRRNARADLITARQRLLLQLAQGKIIRADVEAWDEANPIEWDDDLDRDTARPARPPHGGIATPCEDRFF